MRQCGDCSLCCKVMEIATLDKPPGSWCWHCKPARFRGQIIVAVGRRMYMILPDRDVDLGVVALDEFIVLNEVETATGLRLEPEKVGRDDPRARQFQKSAE